MHMSYGSVLFACMAMPDSEQHMRQAPQRLRLHLRSLDMNYGWKMTPSPFDLEDLDEKRVRESDPTASMISEVGRFGADEIHTPQRVRSL